MGRLDLRDPSRDEDEPWRDDPGVKVAPLSTPPALLLAVALWPSVNPTPATHFFGVKAKA
jgi:hypothetical protein